MAIRDLDNGAPEAPAMPIEMIPDDQLYLDGRIKDLFDRVFNRKKARWDPMTRTRQPIAKTIAEITDLSSIDSCWATIEEDCLAHYKVDDIECWIVRYTTGKYACQVFKNGESKDSFVKSGFNTLAMYLMDTYKKAVVEEPKPDTERISPVVMKRKPGRPARVQEEAVA